MAIRKRFVHAAVASAVVLLGACAAVPDRDLPLDSDFGGPAISPPPPSAVVPELPIAGGPPRPSPGCRRASSGTAPAPDGTMRTIRSGNAQREYLLHVPAGVPSGEPVPLVLDLHGLGVTAPLQAGLTQWSALADRERVMIATPQGVNSMWSIVPDDANPDLPFLRSLVTALNSEHCIDISRTYVSGMSMGGLLASALACRASETFAAFGLVSGIQWKPECDRAQARPAIVFWGTADCVLPYFGSYGPCLSLGPPHTQPTGPVPPEEQSGFPPVDEVVGKWAEHNGCQPAGDPQQVSPAVSHRVFRRCRPGAEVHFYLVEGGGHSWPGSAFLAQAEAQNSGLPTAMTTLEIDATTVMWKFFRAHQLP